MRRSDFHYDLPTELIAQHPPTPRSAGRLLHVAASLADRQVADLPQLLEPDDLLVFNDTRVIAARLFGHKDSGGRVEILVERILDARHSLAQIRASKPPKEGSGIRLEGADARLVVDGRDGEFYRLKLEGGGEMLALLERAGHVPLPPYIDRPDAAEDRERYQTVFARVPGAVAAPTAGLHFDEPLLARLRERGARTATVTLHVGAGTFQPVRVVDLARHRMHAERYTLAPELCAAIATAKAAGRRVVAVGTTVARALETAAQAGPLQAASGETRLFITPGFRFQAVDLLLTNFHLPESTLLMLVCAFGGQERMLAAYRHAVAARYRFVSYGDAMLVEPERHNAAGAVKHAVEQGSRRER